MFSRTMMFAAMMAVTLPVFADADGNQGDSLMAACPGLKTWQDQQRKSHPEQTEAAFAAADRQITPSEPSLRAELDRRYKLDQDARFAAINDQQNQALRKKVFTVDTGNVAWAKKQFATKGFPTAAQVGHKGADEAFTLVQHADQDPAFQASMLEPLVQRGRANEVPLADVAGLTDRVLRAQGKPQRYGTQYTFNDPSDMTKMTLQPTEDMPHLEERRAAMMLPPSEVYVCTMHAMYRQGWH